MKKIIFSLFLLTAQSAFALLPPLHQSVKEIETILSSEDLTQGLPPSQTIHSIVAYDTGYVVSTQEYQIVVEVRKQPQERPGPAQFELIFHEPTKLTQ